MMINIFPKKKHLCVEADHDTEMRMHGYCWRCKSNIHVPEPEPSEEDDREEDHDHHEEGCGVGD